MKKFDHYITGLISLFALIIGIAYSLHASDLVSIPNVEKVGGEAWTVAIFATTTGVIGLSLLIDEVRKKAKLKRLRQKQSGGK